MICSFVLLLLSLLLCKINFFMVDGFLQEASFPLCRHCLHRRHNTNYPSNHLIVNQQQHVQPVMRGLPSPSSLKDSSSSSTTTFEYNQDGVSSSNRRRQQKRRYNSKALRLKKKQRDQLHKVMKSILYYGTHDDDEKQQQQQQQGASDEVMKFVKQLSSAKNKTEIGKVGQQFDKQLDIVFQEECRPILERLLKATALCGLLEVSTKICYHILDDIIQQQQQQQQHQRQQNSGDDSNDVLPSHMSYMALCNGLRNDGRKDDLEQLLLRLGEAANAINSNNNCTTSPMAIVNVFAFNTLLACLCETCKGPDDPNLLTAFEWIQNPKFVNKKFVVNPDTTSYNTVLRAAARTGNTTISDKVWMQLTSSSSSIGSLPTTNATTSSNSNTIQTEPDIRSYNFRLQSLKLYEDQLSLFDEIMDKSKMNIIIPDRYTIDLMILPLIRAGRVGDVESIIENFVTLHNEQTIKDSFSAFLLTLVKRGELSSARALFDTYVMPRVLVTMRQRQKGGQPPLPPQVYNRVFTIEPDVRHFNILIDGYRRAVERYEIFEEGITREEEVEDIESWRRRRKRDGRGKSKIWNKRDDTGDEPNDDDEEKHNQIAMDKETAQYEGRRLFKMMRKAQIKPDPYTLTSMMGLCKSSDELLMLLKDESGNTIMSPAIARAAITNFGRLGDPSSSCALFDACAPGSRDLRIWNVLIGSLTEGAKMNNLIIDLDSSSSTVAATVDDDDETLAVSRINRRGGGGGDSGMVSTLINGMSCTDAVLEILNVMTESNDKANSRAPNPNSQTYCLVASALQYVSNGADDAMELFQSAISEGIPADGRFINAIFRCFGDDIDGALDCWKNNIRKECLAYEERTRRTAVSPFRSKNKNLIAAYNGLLYVCGRALRPDIALRLAFAMEKEGIEPNEVSLNNYCAGKRLRKKLEMDNSSSTGEDGSGFNINASNRGGLRRVVPNLLPKINLVEQYENLFYVECTKYDRFNKRMAKDRRVRIIV